MVEFYDPETKDTIKPRKLTRVEITRNAWDRILAELREETNIPTISYAYYDKKNEFEIRLRGTRDQYMRTEYGEMRLLQQGIYPRLSKTFSFKGEGKTPYASTDEMEKWQGAVMKWFKSLDGQRELVEASEIPANLEVPNYGAKAKAAP